MTSFISKTTDDPKKASLLLSASESAVSAVERMIRAAGADAAARKSLLENYVDLVFTMEVRHAFPTLSAHEQDLLVSVAKVRNAIGVQLNGFRQWRTPEQKADHQAVTAHLKTEYVRLQREILELKLEDKLDPVQRVVLSEEFLSIPIDRESSTSLFFKTTAPAPAVPAPEPKPASAPPASAVVDASKQTAAAESDTVLRGRRVLLVDDEVGAATAASHALSRAGYRVSAVDSGLDGYMLAANNQPHLILLDAGGPADPAHPTLRLSGMAVLKMLVRLARDRGIPLVVMARGNYEAVREAAAQAGVTRCVPKPRDMEQMLELVRESFGGAAVPGATEFVSRPTPGARP